MNILYFAWVKDRTGTSEERLDLPEGVKTLSDLVAWLKQRSERHAAAFADMALLRVAVNQEMADENTPIGPEDEVAFFPPMTGG